MPFRYPIPLGCAILLRYSWTRICFQNFYPFRFASFTEYSPYFAFSIDSLPSKFWSTYYAILAFLPAMCSLDSLFFEFSLDFCLRLVAAYILSWEVFLCSASASFFSPAKIAKCCLLKRKRLAFTASLNEKQQRPNLPCGRPQSTFGAGELNFCVRDENRWILTAIVTAMVYIRGRPRIYLSFRFSFRYPDNCIESQTLFFPVLSFGSALSSPHKFLYLIRFLSHF